VFLAHEPDPRALQVLQFGLELLAAALAAEARAGERSPPAIEALQRRLEELRPPSAPGSQHVDGPKSNTPPSAF
jgi:hypothetical protein